MPVATTPVEGRSISNAPAVDFCNALTVELEDFLDCGVDRERIGSCRRPAKSESKST
jgi:hypothetical protein